MISPTVHYLPMLGSPGDIAQRTYLQLRAGGARIDTARNMAAQAAHEHTRHYHSPAKGDDFGKRIA